MVFNVYHFSKNKVNGGGEGGRLIFDDPVISNLKSFSVFHFFLLFYIFVQAGKRRKKNLSIISVIFLNFVTLGSNQTRYGSKKKKKITMYICLILI